MNRFSGSRVVLGSGFKVPLPPHPSPLPPRGGEGETGGLFLFPRLHLHFLVPKLYLGTGSWRWWAVPTLHFSLPPRPGRDGLVGPEATLADRRFQTWWEVIRSREFQKAAAALRGYDLKDCGQILWEQ